MTTRLVTNNRQLSTACNVFRTRKIDGISCIMLLL